MCSHILHAPLCDLTPLTCLFHSARYGRRRTLVPRCLSYRDDTRTSASSTLPYPAVHRRYPPILRIPHTPSLLLSALRLSVPPALQNYFLSPHPRHPVDQRPNFALQRTPLACLPLTTTMEAVIVSSQPPLLSPLRHSAPIRPSASSPLRDRFSDIIGL